MRYSYTSIFLLLSNHKLANYGPWAKSGHLYIPVSSYTGTPLHPIVHRCVYSIRFGLPMADFTLQEQN